MNIKTGPFNGNPIGYDRWFNKYKSVYKSELLAIKTLVPENANKGLEIGVGTGRFAAPLGIKWGIEPSKRMREIAQRRGIIVIGGIAEDLPFSDNLFDVVLFVATICFVNNLMTSLEESYRVLKPEASLIIGFIDKGSLLGKLYQKHKDNNIFYNLATFYSVDEVLYGLERANFKNFKFTQTIFHHLEEIKKPEPVKEGYGEGSFVVVRASK
jgi:SAM-dependent methyltransferase